MKLVLYSGYDENNSALDSALVDLIGKSNPKVTFIPSAHHVPEHEYKYFCETFIDHGIKNVSIFNIDQPYSNAQLQKALTSDLIYLSGGNTFYFLKSIRRQRFDLELKNFVKLGGVLAGLSAGSILMTPTIETASYPKFDRDDNNVGILDLAALNLVNFEFFPHFDGEPEYAKELLKQSKKVSWPIYGVSDGGGILVRDESISFYGEVWGFISGRCFVLKSK